jgi:hypothetical protein
MTVLAQRQVGISHRVLALEVRAEWQLPSRAMAAGYADVAAVLAPV